MSIQPNEKIDRFIEELATLDSFNDDFLRIRLATLIKEVCLEALPPEKEYEPNSEGQFVFGKNRAIDGFNDCRQQIITSLSKKLGL